MTSLLFWATLGNTLGSMTTWWLGWLATHKKNRKIFKAVGKQKPLVGSNVMATGVYCLPGRLWSAMVSVCWLVGCASPSGAPSS